MNLSQPVEQMINPSITHRKFYERKNVDWYGRAIYTTYILLQNGRYKKARLANVKAGNVFKFADPNRGENDGSNTVVYRAIRDAFYDTKSDKVLVLAVRQDEYYEEITQPGFSFTPENTDLCRSGATIIGWREWDEEVFAGYDEWDEQVFDHYNEYWTYEG